MSTRKGETTRKKAPKHQNQTAWKFDKHKTDPATKIINSLVVVNCCPRCTDCINWKIKYGKYKPLSQPSKCTKCLEKKVKSAYHILCTDCVKKSGGVCAKCGKKEELVNTPSTQKEIDIEAEFQRDLKALPERKRRTFLRYLHKNEDIATKKTLSKKEVEEFKVPPTLEEVHEKAREKLKELKEKYGKDIDLDLDFDLEDLNLSEEEQ